MFDYLYNLSSTYFQVGLFSYTRKDDLSRDALRGRKEMRLIDIVLRFLFVEVPFSLFLSWITLATMMNSLILALSLGHPHTPDVAIGLFCLAIVLAFIKLFMGADVVYSLVVAWAAYWIRVKQATEEGVRLTALIVMIALLISASIVAIFRFVMFWRAHVSRRTKNQRGQYDVLDQAE